MDGDERTAGPLVLGASGFLGTALLERAGPRAVGVARAAGGPAGARADRGWRSLDVTVPGALEDLLDELRPAAVVNAAALARADVCEREPEGAARLNVELPRRLATWTAAHGARLVHVSTDLVFGGRPPRGERYDEGDPPAPLHVYGRTKAAGEEAVLAADPGALVARLPLLFGDSRGRGLGASDALLAALERGESPRLFDDEWRTPLDVDDAARALLELLALERAGLLHVAGPERLSRFELGHAVLDASPDRERRRERLVRASAAGAGLVPPRPSDVSLDARVAAELLATPLRAVRDALA